VSRESIEWILTRQGTGNAAIIAVGGAEEALEAKPGKYSVKLRGRKGFLKIAIRTGYWNCESLFFLQKRYKLFNGSLFDN